MKEFSIISNSGIGPFKLGAHRNEIWAADRSQILSYYPNQYSKSRSDDFSFLGLHVHYNSDETSKQISFFPNLKPKEVRSSFMGNDLYGLSMEDIKIMLDMEELTYQENDFGFLLEEEKVEFGSSYYDEDKSSPLEYVFVYTEHPRA